MRGTTILNILRKGKELIKTKKIYLGPIKLKTIKKH